MVEVRTQLQPHSLTNRLMHGRHEPLVLTMLIKATTNGRKAVRLIHGLNKAGRLIHGLNKTDILIHGLTKTDRLRMLFFVEFLLLEQ